MAGGPRPKMKWGPILKKKKKKGIIIFINFKSCNKLAFFRTYTFFTFHILLFHINIIVVLPLNPPTLRTMNNKSKISTPSL